MQCDPCFLVLVFKPVWAWFPHLQGEVSGWGWWFPLLCPGLGCLWGWHPPYLGLCPPGPLWSPGARDSPPAHHKTGWPLTVNGCYAWHLCLFYYKRSSYEHTAWLHCLRLLSLQALSERNPPWGQLGALWVPFPGSRSEPGSWSPCSCALRLPSPAESFRIETIAYWNLERII